MLQEVKFGYTHFDWQNLLAEPKLASTPNYVFSGLIIGQRRNYPQEFFQNTFSARYDLTMNKGKHDMKMGAEFLRWHDTGQWQLLSRGEFIFTANPPDLARRFPADAWNDPSRWDLTGLDSLVQRFDQNFGDWTIDIPRPTFAIWFGDTWRMNNQLTVNFGVRWDADWGALNPPHVTTPVTWNPAAGAVYPEVALDPGDKVYPNGLRDLANVAPRAGFSWNVGGTSRLVIRGGSGLYFSIPDSNTTFSQQSFNGERILVNSFANDGQPGFITDPTRGKTGQDFIDGKFPLPAQGPRVIAHDYKMPYTWQSTIGFQTQFREIWGVEADLAHWKGHNFGNQTDPNVFFNPATGYARNPAQGRPDPKFSQIQWLEAQGSADFAAFSTALNRRYRDNWQASVSYTLTLFANDDTTGFQYQASNLFDREAEWARSTEFQRHTIRLNAIRRLPWGVNVSGAYLLRFRKLLRDDLQRQPLWHRLRREPVCLGPSHRESVGARSIRRQFELRHRRGHSPQRARRTPAAPVRPALLEGCEPRPRRQGDGHRRSLQPDQSRELRRLQLADQHGGIWRSTAESVERVSGARLAARLQAQLLGWGLGTWDLVDPRPQAPSPSTRCQPSAVSTPPTSDARRPTSAASRESRGASASKTRPAGMSVR